MTAVGIWCKHRILQHILTFVFLVKHWHSRTVMKCQSSSGTVIRTVLLNAADFTCCCSFCKNNKENILWNVYDCICSTKQSWQPQLEIVVLVVSEKQPLQFLWNLQAVHSCVLSAMILVSISGIKRLFSSTLFPFYEGWKLTSHLGYVFFLLLFFPVSLSFIVLV